MREIKFRSWDKGLKEMFYWGIGDVNDDGSTCTFPSGHSVRFPQMQFTGLTDKNGVEIYEGDFLRHYDHRGCADGNHFQGVVSFEGGAWEAVGDYSEWPDCEVIGNIYENPELLEATS